MRYSIEPRFRKYVKGYGFCFAYQHTSKVLFNFVPKKQFGQLINISQHSLTMMNTVNNEFSFVEIWFTDQISRAPEIEDNVNLTLIIGYLL